MRIKEVTPLEGSRLRVLTDDNRTGLFSVVPYLGLPAFEALREPAEFGRVRSGGYYVEWACGADLSADTIEARLEQE